MEALLPTDARVSVSFICEGPIPQMLPSFVEVRPPQTQKAMRSKILPFYQRKALQLPDSLSRTIMHSNRFALSRVSVREKIRMDEVQCCVMQFLFTDGTEHIDEGLYTLERMLQMTWRRILIFRQSLKDQQTTVNISIGKYTGVPDGAVFQDPDQWGIRTLH